MHRQISLKIMKNPDQKYDMGMLESNMRGVLKNSLKNQAG
jgi:hypothetical protein